MSRSSACDDPPDPFAFLGAPFAEFARLLAAADAAKRRLHAAQIAGDPSEIARADLDHADAQGEVLKFKERGATAFLRFAAELYPSRLQAIHDPEGRVDQLEDVVAAMAVGEAVAP
jgi:hypothetical protein